MDCGWVVEVRYCVMGGWCAGGAYVLSGSLFTGLTMNHEDFYQDENDDGGRRSVAGGCGWLVSGGDVSSYRVTATQ